MSTGYGGRTARLFDAKMYNAGKGSDPFYHSRRWRALRESALKRDGYRDALEARRGIRVQAQTVHHIFPREAYPQYQWSLWNLISLTDVNHEAMHDRLSGALSLAGRRLMLETAEARGIRAVRVSLVIGLPGSGKSTWVRANMGGGLAYDMDAIAGAFRLRGPHVEYHDGARRLARSIAASFADRAKLYSGDVYVIRAAPDVDFAADVGPDRVIVCEGMRDIHARGDYRPVDLDAMAARIDDVAAWAEANGLEVVRVNGEGEDG